jgi:predicted Fe-Mo cluster-binding NifX family protein
MRQGAMMITAIPLNNDRIAGHFTKAKVFGLYDETGNLMTTYQNPALHKGCAGKEALIDMFKSTNVDQIVVRNIGERMYNRLTEHGFTLVQTQSNQAGLPDKVEYSQINTLEPGSIRKSINYENKQKQGGCCNHQGHHHQGHTHECCHGQHAGNHRQHGKRCCQSGEKHGHRHQG